MTPAGTSNELDVQNEWKENTHTTHSSNSTTNSIDNNINSTNNSININSYDPRGGIVEWRAAGDIISNRLY